MFVIPARNVNDAYRKGLRLITAEAAAMNSRNGPVLRVNVPVSTVYERPTERVLFDAQRNANPFFHLFEALWMLNGQRDVATLDPFLSTFKQFSDDGVMYHGAYGHRWRHWMIPAKPGSPNFPYDRELDQLEIVIAMLKRDPTSRRVIIGMWDPARDLDAVSNDIPCNNLIKVGINQERLDIVVFNRSNDVVYGCYGANAVHMSMLQEYLAGMLGIPVGRYTQISCDFHAYLERPYRLGTYFPFVDDAPEDAECDWIDDDVIWQNPYDGDIYTVPLVSDPASFDRELHYVMQEITAQTFDSTHLELFNNRFFVEVAQPMYRVFRLHKAKQTERALAHLNAHIRGAEHQAEPIVDWFAAAYAWLARKAHVPFILGAERAETEA
jgi:hypothetical protein